jgi:hypothetical protein
MSALDIYQLDKKSAEIQSRVVTHVQALHRIMYDELTGSHHQAVAIERLEEFYMWTAKAIVDIQLHRGSK